MYSPSDRSSVDAERSPDPTLIGAGFEALPTQTAILDGAGDIVYTNRAWRSFGEENDIDGPAHTLGVNYLAVCEGSEDGDANTAAEGIRSVLDGEREQFSFEYPCHSPTEQRWFTMRAIRFERAGDRYVLVLHMDITDRKRSEMRVAAQNDELETVDQINTLVHEIIDSLLDGVTRREIEETVCEQVASSHLYASAYSVERDLGGDDLRIGTSAGASDEVLDAIRGASDDPGGWHTLREPTTEGEMRAVRHLHGDDDVPDPLKEAASAGGYRSYLVFPIVYRNTVYGALVVNALRPDAFSERERAAFDVLGGTVGYAINAIESKRLLHADAVTELEFEGDDADSFLVAASGAADCSLTLEGLVPAREGALQCYVTVDGAPPDRIAGFADGFAGVESVRVVSDYEDGGLVECLLGGPSVLHAVTEYGASVERAAAEDGSLSLVVAASPEIEVRGLAEAIHAAAPGTGLVAKRKRERPVRSVRGFREELDARLTARQREVLEAAHLAGYFRRPRESSGAEIADSFDLATPTFHQHLQLALNKLADLALDDPS